MIKLLSLLKKFLNKEVVDFFEVIIHQNFMLRKFFPLEISKIKNKL